MENVFNISKSFVFLGLVELEKQRYLFLSVSVLLYIFILLINSLLIFVVIKEQSLHEPMYILIASLLLNEIFGSCSFYPTVIVDLITSSTEISRDDCLMQAFCILTFVLSEMSTFTIMAFDRYLAICHPLHYATLMTNDRVLKVIVSSWVTCSVLVTAVVLLARRLPLCGEKINNLFCDNMSIVILSCVDASINKTFSAALNTSYVVISALVTIFSYLRILFVCLGLSKDSRQKAIHTLVTHLLNFSIYMAGFLFIFVRYRLETVNFPLTVHLLFSVNLYVFPPIINPLIYGIRTQALKIKVSKYLGINKDQDNKQNDM
ncbi:olfactory receptor 51E1-like [Gastrophryne carolinensis]